MWMISSARQNSKQSLWCCIALKAYQLLKAVLMISFEKPCVILRNKNHSRSKQMALLSRPYVTSH